MIWFSIKILYICHLLGFNSPVHALNVTSSTGQTEKGLKFAKVPAPDGHRCGICGTYVQELCAFDASTNRTMVFDNHCVMDLYNCINGTSFARFHTDNCYYFGNFGYVHGYKQGPDEDFRK